MKYYFSLLHQSFSYRLFRSGVAIFKQSYLFLIPKLLFDLIANLYQTSQVNHYFHTNQLIFSSFYRDGIVDQFIKLLFHFLEGIISLLKKAWKGSVSEKVLQSIIRDLCYNYFRFLSTFLLTAFIVYSVLNLLFGSGFTKDQVFIILSVVLVTFCLSNLEEDSKGFLENSEIIKWFQRIYQ